MWLDQFPNNAALCSAIAERLESAFDETGDHLASIFRLIMSSEHRILSPEPQAHSSIVVAAACVSAGGTWRQAAWPAAAMECAMAAADTFDDIADGEAEALRERIGTGGLLMGAAGLLAVAPGMVVRATQDGVPAGTVADLVQLLSDELVRAADGQARGLTPAESIDAVAAYKLTVAKSGPIGSLAAKLGARIATDDPELLQKYAAYGAHLAVFSQLLNDARDASPGGSTSKPDVRSGSSTVPLVFVGSEGPSPDLQGTTLEEWEARERQRVAAEGGVLAAVALAQAERARGLAVLDSLAATGRAVEPLRRLFDLNT